MDKNMDDMSICKSGNCKLSISYMIMFLIEIWMVLLKIWMKMIKNIVNL